MSCEMSRKTYIRDEEVTSIIPTTRLDFWRDFKSQIKMRWMLQKKASDKSQGHKDCNKKQATSCRESRDPRSKLHSAYAFFIFLTCLYVPLQQPKRQ
jgi:hypothetical protein